MYQIERSKEEINLMNPLIWAYVGDAVLELIASEFIYNNYPELSEGEMTKARAYSVCEESLAKLANSYGFSDFLKVGKCEAKKDGKYRASILADAVEAIIGAIFLGKI